MKFDDLDARMRVFETAHDYAVLPGLFMVARLDGRGFTRLTKEVHPFERPFDATFRDHMVATAAHVMDCGFRVVYGYTESDEISLLFHRDENAFSRKTRKLMSILAGEASAAFSLRLGAAACFDARISELPDIDRVVDYFRWRNEDAHRNALNAYCYWTLRSTGVPAKEAARRFEGRTMAEKNEFLFQHGINFNDIPGWQKRGVGLYRREVRISGVDPRDGEERPCSRFPLHVDYDLPMKDAYSRWLQETILPMAAGG